MRFISNLLIAVFLIAMSAENCSKSSKPEPVDESFYIDLTPSEVVATVGDTLAFTGSINSVEGLFAISFDLVYDTSVMAFGSLSLPSNSILGQNSISFSSDIDDGISISLGRVQTSGNDNVSASGVLFEIDFIAIGSDTTGVRYRDVYIIDEEGVENPDLRVIETRGTAVEVL